MKLKFINLYLSSKYINSISINLNYLMLKSYYRYKNESNHNKIDWTELLWQPDLTVDEIVDIIVKEKIEILCISLFVWNSDFTYMIAKKVKKQLPNIKIIAGGPDVFALNNPSYFVNHPYIDYAVYGDGEEAFSYIIDSILENTPITDGVNIVTREKTYPHRIFYDLRYNKQSSFMSEKDLLETHIYDVLLSNEDKFHIQIRWERARGCPYTCSFCDWSSGLHHKVKRKQSNWREELDFLLAFPITVVPTDANWGIYKEDIAITKYAVKRGKFFVSNFSKLHKDRVYELFDIIAANKKEISLKISLQDIHEDVLENVERPEVPWNEQVLYLDAFRKKHKGAKVITELITGLPGQTIEKQINQLQEFAKAKIDWMICFFWELIPNSPANKIRYQKKFGIEFDQLTLLSSKDFISYEQIREAMKQGNPGWSKSKIVTQSGDMTLADMLTCFALTELYKKIVNSSEKNFTLINESVANNILKDMIKASETIKESKVFAIYDKNTRCLLSPEHYFSNLTLTDFMSRYY